MPVCLTRALCGPGAAPFTGLNLTLQLRGGLLLKRNAEPVEEEALLQPFLLEFYMKK